MGSIKLKRRITLSPRRSRASFLGAKKPLFDTPFRESDTMYIITSITEIIKMACLNVSNGKNTLWRVYPNVSVLADF